MTSAAIPRTFRFQSRRPLDLGDGASAIGLFSPQAMPKNTSVARGAQIQETVSAKSAQKMR